MRAAALVLGPVATVGSRLGIGRLSPGKTGTSCGSFRVTIQSVAAAITAKAKSGPERVTHGSTQKGATAGPTLVPSPHAEASTDSEAVRSSALVRAAT